MESCHALQPLFVRISHAIASEALSTAINFQTIWPNVDLIALQSYFHLFFSSPLNLVFDLSHNLLEMNIIDFNKLSNFHPDNTKWHGNYLGREYQELEPKENIGFS